MIKKEHRSITATVPPRRRRKPRPAPRPCPKLFAPVLPGQHRQPSCATARRPVAGMLLAGLS